MVVSALLKLRQCFFTFVCHGALRKSSKTYIPLLRKIYLNIQNKIHTYRIYIYVLKSMLRILLQKQ